MATFLKVLRKVGPRIYRYSGKVWKWIERGFNASQIYSWGHQNHWW
ncbi:hypothetical protein [Weissella viridescens]